MISMSTDLHPSTWRELPVELITNVLTLTCRTSKQFCLALSSTSSWTKPIGDRELYRVVVLKDWSHIPALSDAATSLAFTTVLLVCLARQSTSTVSGSLRQMIRRSSNDVERSQLAEVLQRCINLRHVTISITVLNDMLLSSTRNVHLPLGLHVSPDEGIGPDNLNMTDMDEWQALGLLQISTARGSLRSITHLEIGLGFFFLDTDMCLTIFKALTHIAWTVTEQHIPSCERSMGAGLHRSFSPAITMAVMHVVVDGGTERDVVATRWEYLARMLNWPLEKLAVVVDVISNSEVETCSHIWGRARPIQ